MLQEGTNTYLTSHGEIKYRFRQGRSDRQHLLVIFSGFRHKGTLDFGGTAINSIQHNILWIYDEFGDPVENSYYLLQGGTFAPRDAVYEFLGEVKTWLGLAYEDMAFAGFSKGGSAALYHGLTLGAGAVISTVPQFAIGSYVKNNWPKVFDTMRAGEDAERELKEMDNLMPELVARQRHAATHVYLLSSHADPQLTEEVQPNLTELRRLRFFNFIVTDSPLITQHIEVTPYNVPNLLALFQLCADKLYPYFGEVEQAVEPNLVRIDSQKQEPTGVAAFEDISVEGGRIELSLTTLIRGVSQKNWGDTDRKLILKQSEGETELLLGKVMDENLSRKYLQDTFVDYRAAASVSPRKAGYSISAFPLGESEMYVDLSAKAEGIQVRVPVTAARQRFFHRVEGDSLLVICAGQDAVTAERRNISQMVEEKAAVTELKLMEVLNKNRLRLQGIFAPFGTRISAWGDVSYYLVVEGEQTYTFSLGMLDRPEETARLGLPEAMRKAYFSDMRGEGVDLSGIANGSYTLRILAINSDAQVKSLPLAMITVGSEADETPTVAVLGSCIVRDVFNSKFIPDWKTRSVLTAAAHQSALVSLASEPAELDTVKISDLDGHSQQCVIEDFSKSVMDKLYETQPEFILVDLFADARFGVAELEDGTFITDNSWKIGASSAYQNLPIKRHVSLDTDEETYLGLFKEALKKLQTKISAIPDYTPTIAIVSVRPARMMRGANGKISENKKATESLNWGFTLLESAVRETLPEAVFLDLTSHTAWANVNHPWSSYVVHYEQGYYDALDGAIRDLTKNQRVISAEKTGS